MLNTSNTEAMHYSTLSSL